MALMTRLFTAQFQPDGNGFVFREDCTGPGYRVTAQERDAVMGEYERRWSRITIVTMIVVISLFLGICYNRLFPAHAVDLMPYFVLGAPVVVIGGTWASLRARAKSLSVFEGRNPDLPALTAEQRTARTPPQARQFLIGIAGVVGVSLASQVLFGQHALLMHAPPLLVAIVPFAGLALVAVVVGCLGQNGKTR